MNNTFNMKNTIKKESNFASPKSIINPRMMPGEVAHELVRRWYL